MENEDIEIRTGNWLIDMVLTFWEAVGGGI